jgi:hypothetical protein
MVSNTGAKSNYLFLAFDREDPVVVAERIKSRSVTIEEQTAGIVPG